MVYCKYVPMSQNRKTGDISQVYLDKTTCPASCPLHSHICYGNLGPASIVWRKYCNTPITHLRDEVESKGSTYIIRNCVCGDIAYNKTDYIDIDLVDILNNAFRGHLAYTYTHCKANHYNITIAKHSKMVINFSCNNIDELSHEIPCCLVVKSMDKNKTRKDGYTFIKCPNTYKDITCKDCKLCMNKNRKSVIVFPIHGNVKKIYMEGFIEL